jgi:predicted ATP-dependent endonuclease of OLD family
MVHRWSHSFLATTRLYFGGASSSWKGSGRAKMSEAELDQAFGESVNKAWLQFYSRNLAEVRDIQETGLRAVLRHVLNPEQGEAEQSTQDTEAIYNRVASFLARQQQSEHITLGSKKTFKQRYESNSNLRQIVDNLDEVERRIESAMVPIKRFIETISQLFSRGKTLKLSGNEMQILLADGRTLPVTHLSSGEKHLIKILLECMTSGPNSILIDEPELSMHIDWQRQLPATILSLNPSCQLILASHSPEVMAEVPDQNIFRI